MKKIKSGVISPFCVSQLVITLLLIYYSFNFFLRFFFFSFMIYDLLAVSGSMFLLMEMLYPNTDSSISIFSLPINPIHKHESFLFTGGFFTRCASHAHNCLILSSMLKPPIDPEYKQAWDSIFDTKLVVEI